jgi:hypothetical protein
MTLTETWLPVVGWEGLYEVSDQGRVRSLNRIIVTKHGVRKRHCGRILAGGKRDANGHLNVVLADDIHQTRQVHDLVLRAFYGSPPTGLIGRHINGKGSDNRLSNLCWDTCSQNAFDRVRHGTHHYTRRTHCGHGHEFTPENTMRRSDGNGRRCKKCWARIQRAARAKRKVAA